MTEDEAVRLIWRKEEECVRRDRQSLGIWWQKH